jgi:rRNA processing protein Krr1/Pno1
MFIGGNIREMVTKAGGSDDRREMARAIQFPKQDADGNTIKVEGRKAVVDSILSQIKEFISQRESQLTETIDVPVEKHRTLIGRGGDIKRQMESQFNVSIDIPRQGGGQTGVKITGQPADVAKAKAHIEESTKEAHGETVMVPRNLHHAISNGGQFFRKVRGDFHVTIDHAGQATPPRPSASTGSRQNGGALPLITDDVDSSADAHSWRLAETTDGDEGEIPWVLHGAPENVEKAKKALETALQQAQKGNAVGYLVLSDPALHRHVIGHGGRKIDAIRKQSNCRVNVPHGKSGDEAIEITGSKEGVEKAKELILAAVKEGAKARD